ncbi:hypothetical protein [Enhygromyxa salina]|uniref:Uncharacterized protein n=1 Tax=Enhygromyxa salina TaxID=215803 RepID=A0A2S9XS63_9BACT|nr:hypothetical protein [Enhygromyxa salina]PRP95699.1 hypothetical protein ENSA7_73330 [Enhygromyxa salina]
MSGDRPGSNKALPPLLEGFGKDDGQRAAAAAAYGKQFQSVELDQFDDAEPPPKPAADSSASRPRPNYNTDDEISAPAEDEGDRPNLEPVSDNAHPPQNRRMPTQPPSSLTLELSDEDLPTKAHRVVPRSAANSESSEPSAAAQPRPPKLAPRHSPAPLRRGLFSGDLVTNLLAAVAVALLIMILPAKKIARNYETSQVEPLLTELDGAIEHPLGVEAGVVEAPEKIAARIHAGRDKVRTRYLLIWLLAGLPLGLGLGFVPRPGD